MRTGEAGRPLDLECFLRVVDRVYAAACVETSWDRALEELCRLGGFGGCALSSIDLVKLRPMLRATCGLSHLATRAAPGVMPRNPLLKADVLQSVPGTVWHDRKIMSPARLATTPFWTDWMQPQSFLSWTCIIGGRDGSEVMCLEIYQRRRGALSDDLLVRLAPHLSRAWRLGRMARISVQHGPALVSGRPLSEPRRPGSPASELPGAPAVNRLRAEFGLTKAEARLALRLTEGASLPRMAQAFDVKLTTIRSQLQQVFAKTGTSRQAELVALLLSHGYGEGGGREVEPARRAYRAHSGYDIAAPQVVA